MTKQQSSEMVDRVEKSIDSFYEAMRIREEMSIRIGKRTTYITRFTMIMVTLLGLILFYLVKSRGFVGRFMRSRVSI